MSEDVYEISVEATFSASHQLRDYKDVLEPLHGHNFRVEVFVRTDVLPERGYIVDFLELEAILKKILAPYEHRHLNELAPFDELNPTTENMARVFFEKIARKLPQEATLSRVRVWEAPTYSASFSTN